MGCPRTCCALTCYARAVQRHQSRLENGIHEEGKQEDHHMSCVASNVQSSSKLGGGYTPSLTLPDADNSTLAARG